MTHNSAALLPAFFAALPPQASASYEVIAVDSASTDGSAACAAGYGAQVIALVENVGFGRACNRGAAAARGARLLFLNPDVRLLPETLETLLRHSRANPDALLAPQTLDRGPETADRRPPTTDHPTADHRPPTTDRRPSSESNRRDVTPPGGRSIRSRGLLAGARSRVANASPLQSAVMPSAALPGRALLVPRALWDALGGFDPRIFLYWEDTELCWRAWLLGYRALEVLDTAVTHPRGTGGGWDAERLKNSVYAHLKLLRWRRALPFVLRQLAVTAVKFARSGDQRLLMAWVWQLWNLGGTLAQRAKIQRRRAIEYRELERLIDAHTARQKGERAARGWSAD